MPTTAAPSSSGLNNREFNPDGPLRVNREGEWYPGKPVNWQPYNVYFNNPYLDAVYDEESGGWLVTEVEAYRNVPITFRSETGIDSLTRKYNRARAARDWGAVGKIAPDLWQRQREDVRKDALDRLRANEAAEAARQERERQRLFEEQQQALADQTQQVEDLRAEQEAQQEQLERERVATQAGVRSLNILASLAPRESTAPTAALTGASPQQRGRRRSPTQSLRIGSSRQGPSVGLNIGV